ncbi:Hypothetical protein PHPALM_11529 [Phytophthora palmivora]|uniref:Integrase n=1 Tax=Phytophthora palmivora TaxID=4796 RepID=A0A2P4Y210_9STRA|nr:Hypothetical protein PHPALM_11529 [Phytophthora palmivora]
MHQPSLDFLVRKRKLTPDLTSHSFRRRAAMHANDGGLVQDWITKPSEKAFAYMLGTAQADQKVAYVLSGLKPKDGANHSSLRSVEEPNLSRG